MEKVGASRNVQSLKRIRIGRSREKSILKMRRARSRIGLSWSALLLCLILIGGGSVSAAGYELSDSSKSAFTQMAEADASLGANLKSQYSELLDLQRTGEQTDERIKSLHDRNEAAAKGVRQLIKEIDADRLAKLDEQVKQAQARHKPLFLNYAALNDRIEAARVLKSKELNAALKIQAGIMKVSVQLARDEIRLKQSSLKAAKSSAVERGRKVRSVLEEVDSLKAKLQAEKRYASGAKQSGGTLWSAFNQAVKKKDAKSSNEQLGQLIALVKKMNDSKRKQADLEQQIAAVIARAKALTV